MKRPFLTLAMVAAMASVTACVADDDPGDSATEESQPSGVEEPKEASTEPAVLSYGEPSGFETVDAAGVSVLEYDQTETAGFHLEGTDPQEAIYLVSYRLDEDTTGWDFDERSAISEGYDQLVANESDGGPMRALTGGYDAVFRYAVFPSDDDKYVYQWNTFIFDGYDLIQVTCQWRNEREQIQAGCQELQTAFAIDRG